MTRGRPDLSAPSRIHVIGIGGAGMGAIAEVLLGLGHTVTGSDLRDSALLDRLRGLGADARVGHDPSNLRLADDQSAPDVVVRSTAIPDHNAEVVAASEIGLVVHARHEILGSLTRLRRPVAIAGTHGKTTTSSMLAVMAVEAETDPSYIIGGDVHQLGSGARAGTGEWFIVEADESDGTFLELGHEIGVVTNVEPDHLEHHGGEDELRDAFRRFAGQGRESIVCADDPGAAALAFEPGVETYGTSAEATHRMVDLERGADSVSFVLTGPGGGRAQISLPMPGMHNARNAAAAAVAARRMGISDAEIEQGLAAFRGVGRRFEFRGETAGIRFVDDYAHLPTEVGAAIDAARDHTDGRLVGVFQPHRYSRTQALAADFEGAFDGLDELILTDVYPSGEAPRPGVDGRLVESAVRRRAGHPTLSYHAERSSLAAFVAGRLQPGDLCLTLGAGDTVELPEEIIAILSDVSPFGEPRS